MRRSLSQGREPDGYRDPRSVGVHAPGLRLRHPQASQRTAGLSFLRPLEAQRKLRSTGAPGPRAAQSNRRDLIPRRNLEHALWFGARVARVRSAGDPSRTPLSGVRGALQAIGEFFSTQRHLVAVRDGIVGALPLVLIGSVFPSARA